MAEYVTVSIPEALLGRAKKLARARRRPVDVVIAELLDEALPPDEQLSAVVTDDEAATRQEMQVYNALHPALKADFMGQHVAILDGQLIDQDPDPAALYERIAARYPDRFVWMTAVEEEPITTLVFRSPKIVPQSTAVFTYNYNSDYHPAMPMVEISIGLPMNDTALDVPGIVDSGADATIIPVRHLFDIGARRSWKAIMRGVTGGEALVDLYAVAIRLGPYRQGFVEVVGDISGDETIVGRDILNHLSVVLNGPAVVVEVIE